MTAAPHILISAGEVSGDMVGARLAESLQRIAPGVRLSGLGGSRMEAAGVTMVTNTNHIGTVGVSEVISAIPQGLRAFAATRRHVRATRPDAAVLIGNDIFNAVVGRWLRHRGVPAIALFPPQVWLWQPLVPLFARCFDLVLAAFPDETTRYQRAGTRTVFVGHYLADELQPVDDEARREARQRLGLRQDAPVVGVLPGSRTYELERLLPVLGETIGALTAGDSGVQVVMPVVDGHQDVVRAWKFRIEAGAVHLACCIELEIAADLDTVTWGADGHKTFHFTFILREYPRRQGHDPRPPAAQPLVPRHIPWIEAATHDGEGDVEGAARRKETRP